MALRHRYRVPTPAFVRPPAVPGDIPGDGGGGGGGSWTRVGLDTWTRTASNGWGTADTGGAWAVDTGASSVFSANGAAGFMTLAAGTTVAAQLGSVSARDVNAYLVWSPTKVPTGGGIIASVLLRASGGNGGTHYRCSMHVYAGGRATMELYKVVSGVATLIAETELPFTVTGGTWYRLRALVTGASPTTLKLRAWASNSEPTRWDIDTTDSTSGLQVAGNALLRGRGENSVSNYPIVIRFTDMTLDSFA